jgi:hypothetical protein
VTTITILLTIKAGVAKSGSAPASLSSRRPPRRPLNIWLHQYRRASCRHIDQHVTTRACRANEMKAIVVNLRLHFGELDACLAFPAYPHGGLRAEKVILT